MKKTIEFTIYFTVLVLEVGVRGECDRCQNKNPVACHTETVYSLCINGEPTYNNITCPENYVCTGDVFICYPRAEVTPSCSRNTIGRIESESSQCGVCSSAGQVFACLNETTIAFCFGNDEPYYESLSYCPVGTVCDLNSGSKFCTDKNLVEPSCLQGQWSTTSVATKSPETTQDIGLEETTEITTDGITTATSTTATNPVSTIITTTELTTTTPILTTTTTVPTTFTTATTTSTTLPTITSTTSTTTTTTESTINIAQDLSALEVCQKYGIETQLTSFPQPNDLTCQNYITCTKVGTSWVVGARSCSSGKWFDPIATKCSETYVCPTSTATTTQSTTTTTSTQPTTTTFTILTTLDSNTITALEICQQNGTASQTSFFALPGDGNCKSYVMCTKPGSSWSATVLICSTNKWFDPILGKCSDSYICPGNNLDATISTQTLTTSTFIPTTSTSKATTPTPTTKATTITAPETTTVRILTALEVCQQNGIATFFALPGDVTCTKYIMCTKPGSSWTAKQLTCSSNKWFDPNISKCNPDYSCPTA